MTVNHKTIYIFGNPLLNFDNMPLKLAPELKKQFPSINFIIQDPNENIKPTYAEASVGKPSRAEISTGKPSRGGELIIIDTVMGIDEVVVINDIDMLETEKIYSMHDFDLAFNLKLLRKIGKLNKVTIFGVPPNLNKRTALEQLSKLIIRQQVY